MARFKVSVIHHTKAGKPELMEMGVVVADKFEKSFATLEFFDEERHWMRRSTRKLVAVYPAGNWVVTVE